MKKTTLTCLLAGLLAGCATDGRLTKLGTLNDCPGGGTGVSTTPIQYGDSSLAARGSTDVARKAEWRLKLNPIGQGWDDATVTISPKPVSVVDPMWNSPMMTGRSIS